MNRYIFVVFLLLFNHSANAANLSNAINGFEREWAAIYYGSHEAKSAASYDSLLSKVNALAKQHPNQAEPMLWQAIIIASSADHQPPIQALAQITQARDILLRTLKMTPDGIGGAVQVTLGSLYYLTPAWPLAFGDTEKAEEFLTSALKINPDSIEANYFYGDFLLNQNQPELAVNYFKKAISLPARKNQLFADKSLQKQAELALNNANERKTNTSKKIFLSLFSNAENN